ncbi:MULTISPECIES: hypothetical protein [unclassified Microbacterium]|uniref:hypothetical protein n=1 Tax=unclassified Microbacterium TaxID=2609290 RepID=UPI00386ADF3F
MTGPFVTRALGRGLAAGFGALQALRHPRPIHSRGIILEGDIRWVAGSARSGVSWIDAQPAGRSAPVIGRLSRSLGLPAPVPDILGLALRVETGEGTADLEFASTGSGLPLRFALLPHTRPSAATFGILLPYRGTSGPVLLRAKPLGTPLPPGGAALDDALTRADWRLQLSFASTAGPWRPFAVITLRRARDQTDALRFDAGTRLLPGAGMYRWVRALRQPSYDRVQRGRRSLSR